MRHTLPIACALALGLTACGFKVEQKAPPINPAPKEAYRFEVWVEDPPRPMRVEKMTAWYGTENCLPRQPISGVYAVSANFPVVVEFETQGEDRYTTTVYDDSFLPSDLYGEGICQWRLSNVETIWSDGTLAYRNIGQVVPFDGFAVPDEFTLFSKTSKPSTDSRLANSLPLVDSLKFGDYEGKFPAGMVRDPSLERIVPPHKSGYREVPQREIGPSTDFLLRSRSLRVEAGTPIGD